MVFSICEGHHRKRAGADTLEIPLRDICNERLNQPVFGCVHLSITVRNYSEPRFHGPLTVRVDFIHGGVNSFLPLFNDVLANSRLQMSELGLYFCSSDTNNNVGDTTSRQMDGCNDACCSSLASASHQSGATGEVSDGRRTTNERDDENTALVPAWSVSRDGLTKRA